MILYSPENNQRIEYVAYEFSRRIGAPVRIVTSRQAVLDSDEIKINYSSENIPGSIKIYNSGFLFSKSIKPELPSYEKDQVWKFIIYKEEGDVPFDFFAGMFFFLTRMEEYLPFNADVHARFTSGSSLLCKAGMTGFPIIEHWIREIEKRLGEHKEKYLAPQFKLHCTIDVDNAFAYQYKGNFHNFLGGVKQLLSGKKANFTLRKKVHSRKVKDPYDTYSWISQTLDEKNIACTWFFLLGNKSRYDRNIQWENEGLQQLIKRINEKYETGIHPSYASNSDSNLLPVEINRLEKITGKKIVSSRQHYLRIHFPGTYQQLTKAGIKKDYTLGFADFPGFRAATCFPFYFYDLDRDLKTELEIHPLAIMDGTLNEYLHLDPQKAKEKSEEIITLVKKFGGECIILWHNETLNDLGIWKGWRDVFLHQLNCARN